MYLRDLAIELSELAVLPEGYTAREFHDSTHAVVERYLDLLPRRKVRMAESSKIILRVGQRPAVGIGAEHDFVVYPDGIAFLWLHEVGLDLDLTLYVQSNRGVQQRMLFSTLHDGLCFIARRTGDDANPLEHAAAALGAQAFPLPEIPEDELRRRLGLLPKLTRSRKAGRQQRRPS